MTANDAVRRYDSLIKMLAKAFAKTHRWLDEWELVSIGMNSVWELTSTRPERLHEESYVKLCVKRRMLTYVKSLNFKGRREMISLMESIDVPYERSDSFEEMIEKLNEEEKQILRLMYVGEYTQKEIAKLTGRHKNTIKNRVRGAYERLNNDN